MQAVKKLFTVTLCMAALQLHAQKKQPITTTDTRYKGLDTALQRVLDTWKGAGFAVAVVEKNKIVYAKGFGYRDYEKKLPVTPYTLFPIGSCTKAFTAAQIGILEGKGKLNIDKPVSTILPELRFFNNDMNNNVTLRDMMSHRTGLPRHDFSWYVWKTPSRDSVVQRIQFQEPTLSLRQGWQYNNFMFTAQGVVTEKLTGKSWEQNIREQFFTPLGMTHSTVTLADMEKEADIARGYELYRDSLIRLMPYYDIDAMAPAGAINSSVQEMANWAIAWINEGKFQGKEIFPANFYRQAISAQMAIGGGAPGKERPDIHGNDYGFGWFLSSYKGHYRVEHGGNIDGFSASTSFFPSDSLGIIVLANQNNSRIPGLVRNIISDKILQLKYYDWNGSFKRTYDKEKAENKAAEATKAAPTLKKGPATHSYTDFAGVYNHPGYGTSRIFVRNDSLFIQAGPKQLWMKHNTYDVFDLYAYDHPHMIDSLTEPMLKLQFQMSYIGEIESFSAPVEQALKPIVFTRVLEEKAIPVKELEKYTGEYLLGGMTLKIYIKDNKLWAFVPGQPDYELVATDKDKFGLKVLKGYSVLFEADKDGKFNTATFMQPNGNFKATRK